MWVSLNQKKKHLSLRFSAGCFVFYSHNGVERWKYPPHTFCTLVSACTPRIPWFRGDKERNGPSSFMIGWDLYSMDVYLPGCYCLRFAKTAISREVQEHSNLFEHWLRKLCTCSETLMSERLSESEWLTGHVGESSFEERNTIWACIVIFVMSDTRKKTNAKCEGRELSDLEMLRGVDSNKLILFLLETLRSSCDVVRKGNFTAVYTLKEWKRTTDKRKKLWRFPFQISRYCCAWEHVECWLSFVAQNRVFWQNIFWTICVSKSTVDNFAYQLQLFSSIGRVDCQNRKLFGLWCISLEDGLSFATSIGLALKIFQTLHSPMHLCLY